MWWETIGNAIIYYLRKLPVIGKNIPKSLYRDRKVVLFFGCVGSFGRFVLEVIKRVLLVGLFVVLPRLLFLRFMPEQANGFGLENCFVYFTIFTVGMDGAFVKSRIFGVTKDSVMYLKGMKVPPKMYFRSNLLTSLISAFFSYWLAFGLWGMNWFKAFYLAILVILSRFVGETIQILTFRITGKRLSELRGAHVFVLLISFLVAYFVPYVRGCVPAAYYWVFQTVWFVLIMILGSFFIYYVWNYDGYKEIATRIHTYHFLMWEIGEGPLNTEPVAASNVSSIEESLVKQLTKWKVKGYRYLNYVFFGRNRASLGKHIAIRALICVLVLFVALVANLMGYGNVVYKAMVSSIPVLVLVMNVISLSPSTCRAMFSQSDRYLLHYGYYYRMEDIMEHYLIRLRITTLLNLIPAAFLCIVYIVAGVSCGVANSAFGTLYICMEVGILSVAFSSLHLTLYYVFQPYNMKMEIRNPWYVLINVLLVVGGYLCIFIETLPIYFVFVSALTIPVLWAIGITLIWKLATRTFRIYNK